MSEAQRIIDQLRGTSAALASTAEGFEAIVAVLNGLPPQGSEVNRLAGEIVANQLSAATPGERRQLAAEVARTVAVYRRVADAMEVLGKLAGEGVKRG